MKELFISGQYKKMAELFNDGYYANDYMYSAEYPHFEYTYLHMFSREKEEMGDMKNLEIMKNLIKNGAGVNRTDHTGKFPTYHATDVEKLKLLHENGANIWRKYYHYDGRAIESRHYVNTAEQLDYLYQNGLEASCDHLNHSYPLVDDKWLKIQTGVGTISCYDIF